MHGDMFLCFFHTTYHVLNVCWYWLGQWFAAHRNAFLITDPLWGESLDFPHKGPAIRNFDVVCPIKLFNRQSGCRWFENPWRPCNVTVMMSTGSLTHYCVLREMHLWHWFLTILFKLSISFDWNLFNRKAKCTTLWTTLNCTMIWRALDQGFEASS